MTTEHKPHSVPDVGRLHGRLDYAYQWHGNKTVLERDHATLDSLVEQCENLQWHYEAAHGEAQVYRKEWDDIKEQYEALRALIQTLPLDDYRFRHFAEAVGHTGGPLTEEDADAVDRRQREAMAREASNPAKRPT